ncbi:SIS domain-containing protein [Paramicrobacterium agarici]|uniref:Galactosamine 6-phosphate isomerase AgaS n=1 Tax=Paramicrobacterium agarici TaxID=630514 RepID=A0A2A9DXH2_9MICO|nr:SIS domain-containing protein [Microbacterium agarici]PFG30692.1 galactosamine 6-phosphate isomerase AgaS [Microbacterium agarici]
MTETQRAQSERAIAAGSGTTIHEIRQQPEVWRRAADVVQARRADLDSFLAAVRSKEGLRIIATGAGTSAFIGGVIAPVIAKETGQRVESIATTDLVSNPLQYLAEAVPTLVVSFARSGNSPESVAAVELADSILDDVHHLVITCNADGHLARKYADESRARVLLMPPESNDVGFAMTSSFTSMLLSALLVFLGDAPELVRSLAASGQSIVEGEWDTLADRADPSVGRVVFLGSGPLASLARESSLKMLELTAGRVASFHDSSLGFRHGPKALLDDGTLVVVYVSTDPHAREYDLDIVAELREAIGPDRVLVVAADAADDSGSVSVLDLQSAGDGFLSAVFVMVAQILAVSFAISLGGTPDNPFPDGSVNRVVRGVTIHELSIN